MRMLFRAEGGGGTQGAGELVANGAVVNSGRVNGGIVVRNNRIDDVHHKGRNGMVLNSAIIASAARASGY